ncbi:MAG: transcription termination/antitermination protein NusG [Thermodesulfovibrionales bacterium]
MNWYVVHTYSGFEEKAKQSIEERAKLKNLQGKIGKILVPKEKILMLKGKKKKETDKRFYPGYILVEMDLDEETWLLIKNTMKVTGFVGGTKPIPVPSDEIEAIVQQIESGPVPVVKSQFNRDDQVKIIDGPFASFVGTIDEVDMDHGRLKVMVSIFGRLTPVELSFSQVEKA